MKMHANWAFPDADGFMASEMRADGSYQRSHLDAAMRFVTDRRCAVDGGAHVGQFALPLSRLFDSVISVEPALDTWLCLAENVKRFGLMNVTIKNVALGSNTSQTVGLAMDDKQAARRNTGARYVVPGGVIPVERIDDWELSDLDFIKLDVEGSEALALRGAVETLVRCRPIVLFESKGFWSRFLHDGPPQQVLMTCGFKFLASVGRDEIWGPK